MNNIRFYVVVPCFNEAKRLDGQAFLDFVRQRPDVGFVFVNDVSTDQTGKILRLMAEKNEHIEVLSNPQNSGKGESVRTGLLHALDSNGSFVSYFDADLATPLIELDRLLTFIDERPNINVLLASRVLMLGSRIKRKRHRHLLGRVYATIASSVFGVPVYDTQCGLKVFRATDSLMKVLVEPFSSRWSFDVEILLRLTRATPALSIGTIVEEPLRIWEDIPGTKLKLPAQVRALWDLVCLKYKYGALPSATGDLWINES